MKTQKNAKPKPVTYRPSVEADEAVREYIAYKTEQARTDPQVSVPSRNEAINILCRLGWTVAQEVGGER